MKRKRIRTHSDGLKIDISGRDLRLNERGEGKKKMERIHTSKEVPKMLSLTKDMDTQRALRLELSWRLRE